MHVTVRVCFLISMAALLVACSPTGPTPAGAESAASKGGADGGASPTLEARRERGEYLVNAVGCHDCHTPLQMGPNGPEPDLSRMLSGHP